MTSNKILAFTTNGQEGLMQKLLEKIMFVKIVLQLLEVVLQYMNASVMTQVLTFLFMIQIIKVLKTLKRAWTERKPSSGGMVLHRKSGSAGRKEHCRQRSQ